MLTGIVGALLFVSVTTAALESPPVTLPASYLPVPIHRQATEYSCGAAAVLSLLTYWQVDDYIETELYGPLGTTEAEGTQPRYMVDFMRSVGLWVRAKQHTTLPELRRALANGVTVILDIQAWRVDQNLSWKDAWEDGHYVILIAMDDQYAFFSDPSNAGGYAYIPIEELLERWHDYENENGKRREYYNLAIFVKGKTPLKIYPQSLTRLE